MSASLLVVGVAALGGLAALELFLRVQARGVTLATFGRWDERRSWEAIRRFGPDGNPRPIPNGAAAWRMQPWNEAVEYRLDDHGFREPTPTTATASCRALAIGDSDTFGYGVRAEQAWPAALTTLFAAGGASIAVLNGGLCGSSIVAQEAWLPSALRAVHPHVVILAVTPWSLRLDAFPLPRPPADATWRTRLETYWMRLARYSAVVDRADRALSRRLNALLGWPPPASTLWEFEPLLEPAPAFRRRWRDVHAVLARMVRVTRLHGAEPLLLYIPLDVQLSRARNRLYAEQRLPYPTHGFVDRDYTRDTRYERALGKTARRLRVQGLHAASMLRHVAQPSFLPDDYHLSSLGHAHVAALVAPWLASACEERPLQLRAALAPSPGPSAGGEAQPPLAVPSEAAAPAP